jgi:hypothetical protein
MYFSVHCTCILMYTVHVRVIDIVLTPRRFLYLLVLTLNIDAINIGVITY